MRSRLLAASLTLAILLVQAVAVSARADDPPSGDDSAKSVVRFKIQQDRLEGRKGVAGRVTSSNPDCLEDQRVTFYRQITNASGDVLTERRIGYSPIEPLSEGSKKSKIVRFGLSRSGPVIGRITATEECRAAQSNVVNYRRPQASQ